MKNTDINRKSKTSIPRSKKNFDFSTLTYQEKLILALALLGLTFLITIIVNLVGDSKTVIDYKEIKGEQLYFDGWNIEDREIYWILNDIIATFIDSYNLELDNVSSKYKENIVYSREDFYDVLSKEYKDNLNKKEYLKISQVMLEKFTINGKIEKNSDFIQAISELSSNFYSKNMYVCKLKTVNSDVESYIGIQLYPNSKRYSIFYLE